MDYFDPHCPNKGVIVHGPHSDQRLKCDCVGCVEARRKFHEALQLEHYRPCVRTNCKHFNIRNKPRRCDSGFVDLPPCRFFKDKNKEE